MTCCGNEMQLLPGGYDDKLSDGSSKGKSDVGEEMNDGDVNGGGGDDSDGDGGIDDGNGKGGGGGGGGDGGGGSSSGKKQSGIPGLYKPPTHEELHSLKETQNLFRSNLMKLQVGFVSSARYWV